MISSWFRCGNCLNLLTSLPEYNGQIQFSGKTTSWFYNGNLIKVLSGERQRRLYWCMNYRKGDPEILMSVLSGLSFWEGNLTGSLQHFAMSLSVELNSLDASRQHTCPFPFVRARFPIRVSVTSGHLAFEEVTRPRGYHFGPLPHNLPFRDKYFKKNVQSYWERYSFWALFSGTFCFNSNANCFTLVTFTKLF